MKEELKTNKNQLVEVETAEKLSIDNILDRYAKLTAVELVSLM